MNGVVEESLFTPHVKYTYCFIVKLIILWTLDS